MEEYHIQIKHRKHRRGLRPRSCGCLRCSIWVFCVRIIGRWHIREIDLPGRLFPATWIQSLGLTCESDRKEIHMLLESPNLEDAIEVWEEQRHDIEGFVGHQLEGDEVNVAPDVFRKNHMQILCYRC